MTNIGPVKVHHVIQICALIGLVPVKYFNWGDVLDTNCGPHKFFCGVYENDKLSLSQTKESFQLLHKKIHHFVSERITKITVDNTLCEYIRNMVGDRKWDIIFWNEDTSELQNFVCVWRNSKGIFNVQFLISF